MWLIQKKLKSLDDARSFLAGSQVVEIDTLERGAAYSFVALRDQEPGPNLGAQFSASAACFATRDSSSSVR